MKNMYASLLTGTALLLAGGISAQSAGHGKTHSAKAKALNAVTSTVQHHPVTGVARGTVPTNDQCSSVTFTALPIDGNITFTGDLTGATIDNDYEAGSSIETAALGSTPPLVSVWHGFTTTDCANVTITFCGITPAFGDAWIILSTACPVGDASAVFNTSFNTTDCADGNITIYYNDLPAGDYYLPIMQDVTNGADGPYSVNVAAAACIAPPPPPANDDCAGAISLTANTWCNFSYFTGVGGTESLPAITCNGFTGDAGDDVWFSFVATAADMTIGVQGADDGDGDVNTGYDAVVELLSGSCGSPTSLDCADATLGSEAEELPATGLTVGTTYYVRVYDWYAAPWPDHTFGICVVAGGSINIGIQEVAAANSAFSVFPNPGTGAFSLQYNGTTGLANVEVLDLTGRMVHSEQMQLANGTTVNMDLSTLAQGNYTVRLTANGVRTEQRLMVK